MFTIIEFNDYRKEVYVGCLGVSSDMEKAQSYLVKHILEEFSSRDEKEKENENRLVVIRNVDRTEYVGVSQRHKTRYQYGVTVIQTLKSLTVQQFCERFMFIHPRKRLFPVETLSTKVTQEWLVQNMKTISKHFIVHLEYEEEYEDDDEEDYEEDYEEDDEDDDKKIKKEKIIESITNYDSIYAIVPVDLLDNI